MTAKTRRRLEEVFDRLWRLIHSPKSITVRGLTMNKDRVARLNRAYDDQRAAQFDGIRG